MRPDGYMPILIVRDLARSRTFYEDVMGFHFLNGDDTSAFYKLGDDVLVLNNYAGAEMMMNPDVIDREPRSVVRAIHSTGVDDVDAAHRELTGKGVEFVREPEDRPWGMRIAFLRDPDGHIWEIHQEISEGESGE